MRRKPTHLMKGGKVNAIEMKKNERIIRVTTEQAGLIRFLISNRLDQLSQRRPSEERDSEIVELEMLKSRMDHFEWD